MDYRVTAECVVHIPVEAPEGRVLMTLYKGAVLPRGVPQDRIRHLLNVGSIERISGSVDPVGFHDGGPSDPPATEAEEAPAEDPERVAARAKLPADGSLPHHAAGQPVWVEWHVAQGGSYEDLKGQDKPTLVELAKSRQS